MKLMNCNIIATTCTVTSHDSLITPITFANTVITANTTLNIKSGAGRISVDSASTIQPCLIYS